MAKEGMRMTRKDKKRLDTALAMLEALGTRMSAYGQGATAEYLRELGKCVSGLNDPELDVMRFNLESVLEEVTTTLSTMHRHICRKWANEIKKEDYDG
jgi:hypothetical protein